MTLTPADLRRGAEHAARRYEPRPRRWATPGQLAAALDPQTRTSPALDLIDRELVRLADHQVPAHGLMIFMSPQEGKSQKVSRRFPEWLLAHDPSLRIAIVSYEAEMAVRWGRQIKRDIAQADRRIMDIRIMADSSAAGRWDTPEGGGLYCIGVNGALTGKPADVIVIDDPVKDREQAESEVYRERVWGWWESVAIPRLAPGGIVCIMMTRWSEDDLAGRILSRPSPIAWRVLSMPAIAEDNDPLRRDPGEEFPSVRGRAPGYFANLRATMSAYVFSGIYQQNPVAIQGNFFRRQSFRYWRPLAGQRDPAEAIGAGVMAGAWLDLEGRRVDLADPAVWRFATCDVAASTKTEADWTVIAVWAIDREGDLILLDRVRARVEMSDHLGLARPLRDKWRFDVLYVERQWWSKTLVTDARTAGIPVAEVVADTDKVTRAIPAAGRVHAGKVWFPSEAPWLNEWEAECVVESTMILTRSGLVPACDIKPGDEVLTHLGRFRPVTAVSQRPAPKLVTIRAKGLDEITLTPEHPIYAMTIRTLDGGGRMPVITDWVPAGEIAQRTTMVRKDGQLALTGRAYHAMTIPVLDPDAETTEIDLRAWFDMEVREPYVTGRGRRSWRIIDDGTTIRLDVGQAQPLTYMQVLDYRFGRVCGLYLAEGSYNRSPSAKGRSGGTAYWSFHQDEVALIEEVTSYLADRWGIRTRVALAGKQGRTKGVNVAASLGRLEEFFNTFGRGAENKRVPWWAWDAPREFTEGLISGWLDGDGHKTSWGRTGVTVSPHLVWGLRVLATRLGQFPALDHTDPPPGIKVIKGRVVKSRRRSYRLSFRDKPEFTGPVTDGRVIGLWVKATEDCPGPETVYNFSVAEDQSYVTTGGTVHNCLAFPRGTNDDQVDVLSYAARIAAAHWTPPRPPSRPAPQAPELERIASAYSAATGNGTHHPDLLSMPLG